MIKHAKIAFLIAIVLVVGLTIYSNVAKADNPYKQDYIYSAKAMEWKYSVPRGLAVAVCEQESRWNPSAISIKGALGVCQIMPSTFTALIRAFQEEHWLEVDGVIGPVTWDTQRPGVPYVKMTDRERLMDPFQNIEWAAYYLSWIEKNVSADPTIIMGTYYGGERHQVVRYQLEVQERWAKNVANRN